MLKLYCRDLHEPGTDLCAECSELWQYAQRRLIKCPFKDKPTCNKCPVHCYKPEMRDRIKKVMRYAGPRMMRHHPILAIMHLWDSWNSSRKNHAGNTK